MKIDDLEIPGLKILSKIGEGGMSQVYLAEQISLKRQVAVKVMRLEIAGSELDVQRFKHEAKTIAHLDHPNIISIYNIGQTSNGEVYFTMPYLNHGDFSNYIIENELEFIQLLQSICDGLSFAHDRGVVHRDIKPENLLFDEFGNARIADFGIAITKNGMRMTKEHQIVGSAQYMSPEQARSLKVDIQTDIYSLGIVIYERLTGKVPFDSDESISILVDHVSAKPPQLPIKMRHWQKLIDRCLEKDPKNRFQSMVELKIALSKVPTNSIQRTNSTINHVLGSSHGKHLKWFIPSLLVVFIIGAVFFNSNNPIKKDVIGSDPVSIQVLNTDSNNNSTPKDSNLEDSIPNDTNTKDVNNDTALTNSSNNNLTVNQPVSITNNSVQSESTQDLSNVNGKQLNIDEIKKVMALQNPNSGPPPDLYTEELLQIQDLLEKANNNIKDMQLTKPKNNNATDQLLQILALSPDNEDAKAGLELIGDKYYKLIESSIKKENYNNALKHTRSVIRFNTATNNINSDFGLQKKALIEDIKNKDFTNIEVPHNTIKTIINIVKLLSPENELIGQYEALMIIEIDLGPQIGDKLLDNMDIETIIINDDLAVTTHEITVNNYSEFIKSTNRASSRCKHLAGGFSSFFSTISWNKSFFTQTESHPVVCVSQSDAQAYGEWLSEQTDNNYRLPTKQEWLLLAAENSNPFEACKTANQAGSESKKARNRKQNFSCNDKFQFTAPVASFTANGFGLFDMQGNVSEWIHCENTSCITPIAMGNSWFDGQQSKNLNATNRYKKEIGYTDIGFRLVRDL